MTTTKTKNFHDAVLFEKDTASKLKPLMDELIARGYKLRSGDDGEQTTDVGAESGSLDAEKARLQSKTDLDALSYALDTLKEPVFIHDEAFCLVKFNRAYAQCTDLPLEEIIGKRYWEVFPLGNGPLAGCAECVAKTDLLPVEFPITLDDGRTFYSKGFAVTDQHGRYRFSVHVLEDITQHKAVEESAAIYKDIMSAMASSAHDAIVVIGNDGKVLFWNAAAEQMFGHRQDDAIGQDMHALIMPERFYKDANKGFAAFKKTGQGPLINKTLECLGLRKNGEEFTVELSISAFQLKGLWHAFGIMRDVSKHKQAEEALRNSEQRLRDIIENNADGMLVLGKDTTIKFVNPAAEVLFGRAKQEMLGKPFGYPVTVDKPAEMDILRPETGSLVAEMRIGQTEWENEPAFVVSLRDITERKQAEDKEKRLVHDLDERVKELTLLHSTAIILQNESLTIPEMLKEMVLIIPAAWQYLECAEARITYGDDSFQTPGFSETQWGLKVELATSDGKNLTIEVVYLEERPLETDGPFLAEEQYLLNSVVEMARASIERKLVEASLERSNRALQTLIATNQALIHIDNEQQLLSDVCKLIVKIGNYRTAWVGYMEGDDEQRLVPLAKAGCIEDYLELLPASCFSPTEGEAASCPLALCILSRSTTVTNATQPNPKYATWNNLSKQFGFGSTVALPLRIGTNGRGVLSIYAAEPNAFHNEEITLLTELAEDLAFGIQTIRMRREHQQSSEKLQNAMMQVIQAIANTVAQRDPYTAAHQRKVAKLAVAVATDMGLDEEQIEGIRMGATIHDIGKSHIPAEILTRPGKLSDEEFAIIKTHSVAGYDIVKGVEFPWPVAQMIRQHHERMDGSGYPDGLKGDVIILEARILAVADVVEAIASHRPYRPALGIDVALKEIQENRSRLYDARAVDSCVRLFENKKFSLEE